jgi:hypothetical protein
MKLDEITRMVLEVSPQLLDAREASAIVESCGVNDRVANSDLGMPHTFAVGEHIFRHQVAEDLPTDEEKNPASISLRDEARFAAQKFSLSFAYALPWTLLLVVEYFRPNLLQLRPEWGGILSLSLIGSLISAGGFSQAITRTGHFYIGIKQPKLALRLCLLFVKWGCIAGCGFAALGFVLANYFRVFPASYLAWGCVNFIMLSALWMFCAMLSVQNRVWRIPLVFVIGGGIFALLRSHFGVIAPMFVANAASVAAAASFSMSGFRKLAHTSPQGTLVPALPRLPVLAYMLLPFFLYGLTYFAFLFVDRIAAGSAIPWASGLSFGIDLQYKQGMDVALFIFFVLAAAVEYMANRFVRLWFRLADGGIDVREMLRTNYRRSLRVVCLVFAVLAIGLWLTYHLFAHRVLFTAVLGSAGYFFVALALFNLILLFCLNRAERALALLAVALVCNGVTGYVLSHLFGLEYAAIGLLVGGIVLFTMSHRVIKIVLREADYFYALA